jgi:hypothetical protein
MLSLFEAVLSDGKDFSAINISIIHAGADVVLSIGLP